MLSHYNVQAGRSVERIAALSDGLFAIAMTLLLLELHLPEARDVHTEAELWRALAAFAPSLAVSVMSFLTLGIFWVGQQSQLAQLARADRDLTWIHIGFLFLVSILPLSTRLLIEFDTFRSALAIYWLNILLLGVALWFGWEHARRAELIRSEALAVTVAANRRRILLAQALYAVGALISIVHVALAIAFIVGLQILYATALDRYFRRPGALPDAQANIGAGNNRIDTDT